MSAGDHEVRTFSPVDPKYLELEFGSRTSEHMWNQFGVHLGELRCAEDGKTASIVAPNDPGIQLGIDIAAFIWKQFETNVAEGYYSRISNVESELDVLVYAMDVIASLSTYESIKDVKTKAMTMLFRRFFLRGEGSDFDRAVRIWKDLRTVQFSQWLSVQRNPVFPLLGNTTICSSATRKLAVDGEIVLREMLPEMEVTSDAQQALMFLWLAGLCVENRQHAQGILTFNEIDRIVKCGEKALKVVQEQDTGEAVIALLDDLFTRCPSLGEHTSGTSQAIDLWQRIIDSALPIRKGLRAFCHHYLGRHYIRRHQTQFSIADLRGGRRNATMAVMLLSPNDTNIHMECCTTLAHVLTICGTSAPSLSDDERMRIINQAIELVDVTNTPPSVYQAQIWIQAWRGRCEISNDFEDIEQTIAIIIKNRLSRYIPSDDVETATYLLNLALIFLERATHGLDRVFHVTSQMQEDINTSLSLFHAGFSVPAMLSDRVEPEIVYPFMERFSVACGIKYEFTRDESYKIQALKGWDDVGSLTSSPSLKLSCSKSKINMHATVGHWSTASEAIDEAMVLMRTIVRSALTRTDREHIVGSMSGLPPEACLVFILSGRSAEEALEVLDRGRCIIASILASKDDDVTALQKSHPRLFEQYNKLLEQTTSGSKNRDHLWTALGELASFEDYIRSLDGFQSFQLGPTADEVAALAAHGPIVTVNVTPFSSHAIIVTKNDGVHCRDLPEMRWEKLQDYRKWLMGPKRITKTTSLALAQKKRMKMQELLKWLWTTTVWPVIDFLRRIHPGFHATNKPSSGIDLPRIFWMAAGNMASMPFHAAGCEFGNENKETSTSKYAISTYVTSLRALEVSRQKSLKARDALRQALLVVGMPETVKMRPLKAHHEAGEITLAYKEGDVEPIPETILNPSKLEVKTRLLNAGMVHFVCHGSPDARDPSKSCLHIGIQGSAERLTTGELSGMTRQNAPLAYLSACSTAENMNEALVDEAIYIAGSMQLLGFHSVVGTMWEADDQAALQLARDFYRELLRFGKQNPESDFFDIVARALHHAVEKLKKEGLDTSYRKSKKYHGEDVLRWGHIFHIGA